MIDHRQKRNGHVRRMSPSFVFRGWNTLDTVRSNFRRELLPNPRAFELCTDMTGVRKDQLNAQRLYGRELNECREQIVHKELGVVTTFATLDFENGLRRGF